MQCCILLRDASGERRGGNSKSSRLVPAQTPSPISRGELLVPLASIKASAGRSAAAVELRDVGTLRLALKRASEVQVECSAEDVAWLSTEETEILEAVEDVRKRYFEFRCREKLRWACGLRAGCRLRLRMSDEATGIAHFAEGVVRYAGNVGKKKARMFGVEITERKFRGLGDTNGRFEGGRYFSCDNNCGVFVSVEALSKDVREVELKRTRARTKSAGECCGFRFLLPPPPLTPPPPPPLTPPPPPPPLTPPPVAAKPVREFVEGERVAVYDIDRVCYYGIVRCIERDALYGDIVGLEMDTLVSRGQFPNTLSLDHLSSRFFVPGDSHSKIVLPVKSLHRIKHHTPDGDPGTVVPLPMSKTQWYEEINDIHLELEKLSSEKEEALCELIAIRKELKQGRAENIRLRASLVQLEKQLSGLERAAGENSDPLLSDWLLV